MNYVAHPYAFATSPGSSPSKSASIKTHPQRPKVITSSSSPAFFFNASSTSSAESAQSPSPITFARASVISPLHDSPVDSSSFSDMDWTPFREKAEKKDRRRGLIPTERVTHAGLDALLRVPEVASPRAVPQPRVPHVQLARSPTNLSVTPSIVRQSSPRVSSCNGNESDASTGSSSRTSTPRATSPTPSSGTNSTPSTPGQPRTPVSVSSDHEFSYPIVAPLSICKANRTPSPSPPCKQLDLPTSPVPLCKSDKNLPAHGGAFLRKRRSQGRFGVRNASVPRAEELSSDLRIDTAAARLDNTTHGPPTLTGILEEFEREALKIPFVPSRTSEGCITPENATKEPGTKEEDESEWIDIPESDRLEDAEYYRADIASHLQLFSSSSSPPISRTPSYMRHRRGASSSSSSAGSRWQLPPARPDSISLPSHFRSSFTFSSATKRVGESLRPLPSLPPLPALPNFSDSIHFQSLRRPSTSSLASTASARSNRSNVSTSSRTKRRSTKNSRYSIARRSAALGVGRRRSSNTLRSRPLPPIPGASDTDVARLGPSPALDPAYLELVSAEDREARMMRPPPRFSIPVSVDEEDDFVESVVEAENGMRMTSVIEEDEDEDGMLDPFVLERFSVVDASSTPLVVRNTEEREGVDPFTVLSHGDPVEMAETNVPVSPSTTSPSSLNQQLDVQIKPYLLIPESPAPSSSFCGSSNGTFDVESLYSSYACFSPGRDSNNSDNSSRKESAESIYLDDSGRRLQSRWSVSTFASAAPPSSTRSFFPIPKLVSTVPSRLSSRLRAARERAVHQAREREAKEPVVKPFPFFPTPTPPSPKRKTNPGPGKYVPKPELMPQKVRAEMEKASIKSSMTGGSPRTSCDTIKTSTSSSSSTASSRVPSAKSKENAPSNTKEQYPRCHTFRQSPARSISPSSSAASSTFSCSSPLRSLRSQSSADSLSAFPFTLGGESLSPLMSASNCNAEAATERSMKNEQHESGLRRKVIPRELFV